MRAIVSYHLVAAERDTAASIDAMDYFIRALKYWVTIDAGDTSSNLRSNSWT